MKIVNETRGEVAVEEAEARDSPLGKALGLMFRRKAKPLVFPFPTPQRVRLHMLFVFTPIDVAFLNREKEVVELKESLKPWQAYKSREKCSYVLELPPGTIKRKCVGVGDKLSFSMARKNI